MNVMLKRVTTIDKSFFLFTKEHPIRQKIITALEHKYVTIILLITIVIDVATQVLDSPPMSKNEHFSLFQDSVDIIITIIFSIEMLMRMISMGVVLHKDSYLQFHFYRLDFVINVFLYVGFSGKLPIDVSALRAIRPLRMLRFIRGVRLIFAALGKSVKSLSHVLLLVGFFFVLFGIAGLQIFGGKLKYQCVDFEGIPFNPLQFCNPNKSIEENGCECREVGNPDLGMTGFDHIGISFFTIYRCMTGEDWQYTMYWVMERVPQAWIYFVALQFLIGFVILNLFTSVMTFAFMKAREEDEAALFHVESTESTEGKEDEKAKKEEEKPKKEKEIETEKEKHIIVNTLAYITTHIYFVWFMNICIIINTIFMAMYHHDMSVTFVRILGKAEIVFNVIFIVELVMKVIACNGPISFCKDKMNIFDFVVVVATMPDLFVDSSVNISFLRTFRLLRVMRLVKNIPVFKRLMTCAFRSIAPLAHLSILLAIVMLMYCVLGMQLFGGRFKPESRFTFDDFPHAFLTMFAILTGEWVAPYYDAMQTENGWATPFFVISYYMFTNYVILNLLITIILENFELADNEKEQKQIERYQQKVKLQTASSSKSLVTSFSATGLGLTPAISFVSSELSPRKSQDTILDSLEVEYTPTNSSRFHRILKILRRPNSLFLFEPSNVFRQKCFSIVQHNVFDYAITVAILVGAILLALEDPARKHNETFIKVVSVTDNLFLAVFTVEAVLKMIALGFVFPSNSYLRSPWNILDFVVLLISYITSFATSTGGIFRVLRVARVLRPLRMINKNPSLKFIISSIISSMPAVGSVCLLLALFILMFGIFGVILFSGTFYYCNDSSVTMRSECVGYFIENNVTMMREWQNVPYNFDNIGYAALTMFQLTTLDAWPVILIAASDAVGVDKQPKMENQFYSFFFFVAFVLLVSFFIVNLLVGEIVYHFYESRGDALLTGEQKKWRDGIKRMMTRRVGMDVRPPSHPLARKIYDVVNPTGTNYFEMFIIGVIILNVIVMMAHFHGEPDEWVRAQDILNIIFVIIFVAEAILKIIALRLNYFKQPWNLYDFFVTLLSLILICIPDGEGVSFMRAFRLFRLFRVVKAVKQLRLLFATLLIAVPSALNVGLLLLLLMFIFAILGVQLFGEVKFGPELNENANFQNFPNAMLTLYRVLTLADWVSIQWDCMVQPPDCTPGVDCGYSWAPIYFVVFILLGVYMMLNLFIVIMVDSFQAMSTIDDSVLSEAAMQAFKKQWRRFDKDATGKISLFYLREFVTSIPPPLGIPAFPEGKQQFWFIYYELKRRWAIRNETHALPASSVKPPKPFTKVSYALLLKVLLKCNAKSETLEYSKRIKWEQRQTEIKDQIKFSVVVAIILGFVIRRRIKKRKGLISISASTVPSPSPLVTLSPPEDTMSSSQPTHVSLPLPLPIPVNRMLTNTALLSPPSSPYLSSRSSSPLLPRRSSSPNLLLLDIPPSPLSSLSRRCSSPHLSRNNRSLSRRSSSPFLSRSPSPLTDDELFSSTSTLLPPNNNNNNNLL